mmetsp:Transcript_143400/g.458411  ORF Transcript_143400/g.458411 Transcript_143400/m.458411 type:complete len:80 (-) Transcript_143400:222-461(-)
MRMRSLRSEAAAGGPIALVRDGDTITVRPGARLLSLNVSDEELASRRAAWRPKERTDVRGTLSKYATQVRSAAVGATTT